MYLQCQGSHNGIGHQNHCNNFQYWYMIRSNKKDYANTSKYITILKVKQL